jgi:hypothetical protein
LACSLHAVGLWMCELGDKVKGTKEGGTGQDRTGRDRQVGD